MTDWSTRVEHELIPPAAEGEPHRATVSIITKSTVTMVLIPDDEPEEDQDADSGEASGGGDPAVDGRGAPSALLHSSSMKRLPDERESRFDLESATASGGC